MKCGNGSFTWAGNVSPRKHLSKEVNRARKGAVWTSNSVLWALGAASVQAPGQELPGVAEEQRGTSWTGSWIAGWARSWAMMRALAGPGRVVVFTLGETE